MRQLLFGLLLLWTLPLAAQKTGQRGQVTGMLLDSASGKPLREATVSLLSGRDSSYLSLHLTDGDGRFQIRNLGEGSYRLLITYVGFQNISRRFNISADKLTVDFEKLLLQPQAQTLNEVNIVQERAPITVKEDTLEFNAGSFKTKPNAAVEDLLKKLPGMEVARDGTIRAQGQQVNRVLVDGKPFFGDDPKMATRNLPADIVDKVQLYDQQSDQAAFSGMDDGNREKTINITTKRDKRKGYFGRNSLGAGVDEDGNDPRYAGNISLNRFNNGRQISLIGQGNNINQQNFSPDGGGMGFGSGGMGFGNGGTGGGGMVIVDQGGRAGGSQGNNSQPSNIVETLGGGLNYRDGIGKRAEIATSYFANRTTTTTEQQSRRENIVPAGSAEGRAFINDQSLYNRAQATNHRLNLRLDWKLDSLTSLRFTPNLSWNGTGIRSLTDQRISTPTGQPLSSNETRYHSDGNGMNGFSNLLLMRKFRREGRTFSVNLTTALSNQSTLGLNQATNRTYGPDTGIPRSTLLNQQIDQDNYFMNNNLTLSYTEPLSMSKKLEFRYGYSGNRSRSAREVNDFDETTGLYDDYNLPLSNRFSSQFTTHRLGMTLQTRRLRYTYGLGFDVQQAQLRADNRSVDTVLNRPFTNLLPTAMFTYNWTRNRTLRLNYRTRINAPSVSQLQPVADNTNPLNIRLGNPGLRPEFYNTVTMSYNAFSTTNNRSIFGFLNLNQVANRIASATTFSQTGAQTTQPVNTDGYYSLNGFLSLGRRVSPWKLNVSLNTNAALTRGVSFVNRQQNVSWNRTIGQGVSLASNFNGKIDFSVAGNLSYQTADFSLQASQNTEFFTKSLDIDVFYQLPGGFTLTTDLLYLNNTGRSAGFNQNYALLNAALSKQFFRNKNGELRLQAFDLLNQNRSIQRNVTETYVEDVQSRVLRRYFLLSFVYNLRKFGV
ncbi:outer membrane beta-barrel protein [Tellurirhabdus rosea]|uniref:outer membrane beta-barrel protein n=1 Tax=Tellurirhabdus rosea TaxID=2674997 RepID=UPI002251E4F0|nr:TonB-dependent receptor [Tellurirhabdus rosea]